MHSKLLKGATFKLYCGGYLEGIKHERTTGTSAVSDINVVEVLSLPLTQELYLMQQQGNTHHETYESPTLKSCQHQGQYGRTTIAAKQTWQQQVVTKDESKKGSNASRPDLPAKHSCMLYGYCDMHWPVQRQHVDIQSTMHSMVSVLSPH
jgi:hypothetical protein